MKLTRAAVFDVSGLLMSKDARRFCWLSTSTLKSSVAFRKLGILVVISIAPPTPAPGPACTLAGPLMISTESTLLKLTGAP